MSYVWPSDLVFYDKLGVLVPERVAIFSHKIIVAVFENFVLLVLLKYVKSGSSKNTYSTSLKLSETSQVKW